MPAREEIEALLYGYAERLDAGDLEGVAALFAHASYGAAGGEVRRGAVEVLAALRRFVRLHDGVPRTRHLVSNVILDLDETNGTAAARSYFTVVQAAEGLPLQVIIAGRYHDRFARRDGGWHFTERRIFMDLTGDLRQHLHHRPG